MGAWFSTRFGFLWAALNRPLPKWLLLAWAVLSVWDTATAQLLPASLGQRLPRAYEFIEAVTGVMPWWAWALVGLSLVTIFTVESAVRQKAVVAKRPKQEDKPAVDSASRPKRVIKEERDIWLIDAIYYIALKRWVNAKEISFDDLEAGAIKRISDAANGVRQAGRDGKLSVWGKKNFAGTYELIPKGYWTFFGFDELDAWRGDPEQFRTKKSSRVVTASLGELGFLRTSKWEVEELWPLESI